MVQFRKLSSIPTQHKNLMITFNELNYESCKTVTFVNMRQRTSFRCCFHSWELLHWNTPKALRRAVRYLKPSGKFVCTLTNLLTYNFSSSTTENYVSIHNVSETISFPTVRGQACNAIFSCPSLIGSTELNFSQF